MARYANHGQVMRASIATQETVRQNEKHHFTHWQKWSEAEIAKLRNKKQSGKQGGGEKNG